MEILHILDVTVRHAETLYYLHQEKLWECKAAAQLRDKLLDLQCHLSTYQLKTNNKLKGSIPKDVSYVTTQSLKAVKINIYALINMSSSFYMINDTKACTAEEQIADVIDVVDAVKQKLKSSGVFSDAVENISMASGSNISQLITLLSGGDQIMANEMSEPLRKNLHEYRKFINVTEKMKMGRTTTAEDRLSDIIDENQDNQIEENLFAFDSSVKRLMDELSRSGVDHSSQYSVLQHVATIWADWHIDRRNISFARDEWDDKVLIGQGGRSAVYAGHKKAEIGPPTPVAVKTKPMLEENISDILREVFVHLIAQHHCIVMFCGMWYPSHRAQQALIILERMPLSLGDALRKNKPIDRFAVLRDISAAIVFLHEKDIVHRDVKPGNIFLNEAGTQAKLADFGSSRHLCRRHTTTSTQNVCTDFYTPPDMLTSAQSKTLPKWDCWSMGLLMCQLFNPEGQAKYVEEKLNDAYDAALEWGHSIDDSYVKAVATSCLKRECSERPSMRRVYLHLVGALQINEVLDVNLEMDSNPRLSNEQRITVPADTHQPPLSSTEPRNMNVKTWKDLSKFENSYPSKPVKVFFDNNCDDVMLAHHIKSNGKLHQVLRIGRNQKMGLEKGRDDGGVFYVVTEERSNKFRAAFVVNHFGDRKVFIGPNYISFHGWELNQANKGGITWPLCSTQSESLVSLKIKNNVQCAYALNKVDRNGVETVFVPKIDQGSTWIGQVGASSVLVFRTIIPTNSQFDRSFMSAVLIPQSKAASEFTIELRAV